MLIYEIDAKLKHKIKSAIDKIDDDAVLNHVKSTVYDAVLQDTLKSSPIEEKIGAIPYVWFKHRLEASKTPLESKVHFVKLLSEPKNLLNGHLFHKNVQGNIVDHLSPKFKNNETFQDMALPIWRYKIGGQGGMGPAEMFFILFSDDATKVNSKEGGDVKFGEWKVELKKEGSVSPGSSNHRVVDSLNAHLIEIAKKEGIWDEIVPEGTQGTPPVGLNGGWFPDFFKAYAHKFSKHKSKELFGDYLRKLYGDGTEHYLDRVYNALGTPNGERELGPMIIKKYQEIHKWDSICFVDDGFKFVNMSSFEHMPELLTTSIKLKRGGDTQAVADGYMNVGIAKEKKGGRGKKVSTPTTAPKSKKGNTTLDTQFPDELANANTDTVDDMPVDINMELDNPDSPISKVIATLPPEQVQSAQDMAQQLLDNGETPEEIAKKISSPVTEEINRLRHLVQFNL